MVDKIQDHAGRALSLLPEQFRGKATLEGLLKALSTEVQDLEDKLHELIDQRGLPNATGDQLDGIGEIVGEPRNGRDDPTYRTAIRRQIQINVSNGEPEVAIGLAAILTDSDDVELIEYHPGAVVVRVSGPDLPEGLHQAVDRVVPAGVEVQLVSTEGQPAFGFDGGTDIGGFAAAPNWTAPDLYPAFGFSADGYSLDSDYAGFGANGETGGGVLWGADWGEEDTTRSDDPEGFAVAVHQ